MDEDFELDNIIRIIKKSQHQISKINIRNEVKDEGN